jgi:hypothetical protein
MSFSRDGRRLCVGHFFQRQPISVVDGRLGFAA